MGILKQLEESMGRLQASSKGRLSGKDSNKKGSKGLTDEIA